MGRVRWRGSEWVTWERERRVRDLENGRVGHVGEEEEG